MPIHKIVSSKRAKAAIAAVLAAGVAIGGLWPASTPPAVILAVDHLIKPWESLVLKSHWDRFSKRWDICFGETKDITAGMTKTKDECEAMLIKRVTNDYYRPLTKCIADFDKKPVSLQASMISLAYNYGAERTCATNAARLARVGKFRESCEAATSINRAGGQVVEGLVRRREMGDAQRIGEAELCVSGLAT
ncbi:glycoside hydrolase family protein [Mesorhizobium sp. B2-4-8]|uniref:glycoside hydrolase family protein n=1 Tax=Mesorhizobium sp. B2-4-8 TaxID=2589941 RepID=UPI0011269564|nr:glycoside hydrolase family protein [Mesorhizobium sp. B2-4-8]TPL36761.1 lysozyme [Mesorhizobium sp. B2-4-8]